LYEYNASGIFAKYNGNGMNQAETHELKARIAALEARIEELEGRMHRSDNLVTSREVQRLEFGNRPTLSLKRA
jgi:hypothetical protein